VIDTTSLGCSKTFVACVQDVLARGTVTTVGVTVEAAGLIAPITFEKLDPTGPGPTSEGCVATCTKCEGDAKKDPPTPTPATRSATPTTLRIGISERANKM
jgi:hypothetical protein